MGKAVLCTPFPRASRSAGDADRLEREVTWISEAAAEAGFRLEAVQDLYDSSEQIVDRICTAIRDADMVVVIVNEKNPNVFFEAGFGLGLGKPIFYLAREGMDLPFDISGIECFIASELDQETRERACLAIAQCYRVGRKRLLSSPAFGQMQARLTNLQPSDSLFSHCQRHAFDELVDWVGSWTDKSLEVVGPAGVLDMGCFIVSQLEKGGFATSYYSGHKSWRYSESNGLAPDYFAATRQAVKRGAKVSRVYVVDRPEQVEEEAFRQRAWADASAGITIKYVLTRDLPDPNARDFGIWDDALLGEVQYDTRDDSLPVLQRCQYWSDRRHVDRAREWQQRIERLARPCPDLPSEDMLLLESAPDSLTGDCRDANILGVDCTDYHKSWQPLRLGNSVSTPKWHADFYSSALDEWSKAMEASDRRPKILITGLADYGMLYWVAQSIDALVRERCEFHVLDICETPLGSARWLKGRLHQCDPPLDLNLICRHEDVFDNSCDSGSFDLICSDAFITRFEQETDKRRLVEEWLRLRAPEGWIVTTARVRHGKNDIREADRQAFSSTAASAVEGARPELMLFVREKAASNYARYIKSSPFQSEAAITDFLGEVLPDDLGWQVSFAAIADWEMVAANYAYIQIGRGLDAS